MRHRSKLTRIWGRYHRSLALERNRLEVREAPGSLLILTDDAPPPSFPDSMDPGLTRSLDFPALASHPEDWRTTFAVPDQPDAWLTAAPTGRALPAATRDMIGPLDDWFGQPSPAVAATPNPVSGVGPTFAMNGAAGTAHTEASVATPTSSPTLACAPQAERR